MCVITIGHNLTKKQKNKLDDKLFDMAESNPHGVSYQCSKDGFKVHRYVDSSDILTSVNMSKLIDSDLFMIHFRLATHGTVSLSNCHHFDIGLGRTLCHNGMIAGIGNELESDTNELAQALKDVKTKQALKILEALASSGNGKFLIFDSKMKIYYKVGNFENDNGLIVSNKHYCRMTWYSKNKVQSMHDWNSFYDDELTDKYEYISDTQLVNEYAIQQSRLKK
jgi:predicted glutamine amidotransferase